jgi:hypothetical protein
LASRTGLIGLAVGEELLGEVPCLTIDVLILLIKTSATLLGRSLKDVSDNNHELLEFGLRDSIGLSIEVKLG